MIEIFHSLIFQEFINELGKRFSIAENIMKLLGIVSLRQNIWPKGPEDIISSLCI